MGYARYGGYIAQYDGSDFVITYTESTTPNIFRNKIVPAFGLQSSDFDIRGDERNRDVVTTHIDRVQFTGEAIDNTCLERITNLIGFLSRNELENILMEEDIKELRTHNANINNNSTTNTNNIKHTKRMEKIIFSESLINRLNAAKANGSIFADIILKERKKKHSEAIPNSIANHFDTVLVKNCGIPSQLKVSCCNKVDDDRNPNHGNPQFPYLSQNRTRLELWNFALLFNEVEKASLAMSAADLDYQTKLFQETMLMASR